jgi:PIN domain nuclease of toxin-antitoxin system
LIVLDASALLSLLNKEPGWQVVARHVVNQDATISTVNYCEVLQKAAGLGVPPKTSTPTWTGLGSRSVRSAVSMPGWRPRSIGTVQA